MMETIDNFQNLKMCRVVCTLVLLHPSDVERATWSVYLVANVYELLLRVLYFDNVRSNPLANSIVYLIFMPNKNFAITFIRYICGWWHGVLESAVSLHLGNMLFHMLSRFLRNLCALIKKVSVHWYVRASLHWWVLAKYQSCWRDTIWSKRVVLRLHEER